MNGKDIDDGWPEAEPAAVSDTEIRLAAMNLLAMREHSRAELEQKLLKRQWPQAQVYTVLDVLAEEGLQSNLRYAEARCRMRASRGYGPHYILAELRQRGVDASDAQAGLAACEREFFSLAAEARNKRFGVAPPEDIKQRAKQSQYLSRRGFSAEQIRYAFSQLQ